MLARLTLAAALLLLWSCGGKTAPTEAPDPKGRQFSDYLKQGQEPDETEAISKATDEASDAMTLHFIDVGQGSATLLEFPCGAILIDTGGEKNSQFDSEPNLIGYLNDFFARRSDLDRTLDALVITHPHIDHTRSIPEVLKRFRVRNVIDNGDVQDDLGGRPQLAMHDWLFDRNT